MTQEKTHRSQVVQHGLKKKEVVIVLVALTCLAGIFHKPIFSSDIWHHLKMGEHIAQNGYVLPEADPFCYTTRGKTLVHHEWLSQIILYHVHKAFGFSGIRLGRTFLMVVVLVIVFWIAFRFSGSFAISLLVLLLAAYLVRTRYLIRPELFSLLLFSFCYGWLSLSSKRWSPCAYVLFFFVCVLWVNLHPFMIFFGAVIGLFLVHRVLVQIPCIARWFEFSETPFNPTFLLLLFLIATLINPYGYGIYEYVFAATAMVKEYIQEWQPIFIILQRGAFRTITGGVWAFPIIMKALVIGISALFLAIVVGSYARKIRWTVEDLFLGLLLVYMAVSAARFAWLLIIPLVLTVKYGKRHLDLMRPSKKLGLTIAAAVWAGVAVSGLYWLTEAYNRIPYNVSDQIHNENYPVGAVRMLKQADLSVRIFNPLEWGGYLIYHLFPKYKPFIDTRSYLHGETSVAFSIMIQYQSPGFERLIDKHGFDLLLFKKMYGDTLPRISHNWLLIFEDANSAMYLRNNDRNRTNLAKVNRYYKRNDLPFDPKEGADRMARNLLPVIVEQMGQR